MEKEYIIDYEYRSFNRAKIKAENEEEAEKELEKVEFYEEEEINRYDWKINSIEEIKQVKAIKEDNYFKGDWKNEDIIVLAKYNNWEIGADIKINENDIESVKDEIIEKGNVGDSELRFIYSDKYNLAYLSIDSNIKVFNLIDKEDFSKTRVTEF